MNYMDCGRYTDLLRGLHRDFPHWDGLNGKTLLISGGTGMIGSLLVDALMLRNRALPEGERCRVTVLGRSEAAAAERFAPWRGDPALRFAAHDVREPLPEGLGGADYLIHAASTTHPLQYAAEPVNTILANVLGTKNLLDLAGSRPGSRLLLLSSVEIYGENRGDAEYFAEDSCGYIDCNTLRAGYPEGKRVSEALCQAYIQERDVDARIIRLPRTYGPTMRLSDSKAHAQFIKKGVAGEDIVLKSRGDQFYSYGYIADVALGILYVLLRGERGRAYNLADSGSDISLRDMAELIAEYAGTRVVYELPSEEERRGYSPATRAVMSAEPLRGLGWRAGYDIKKGLYETMDILRQLLGREKD